MRTSIQTKIAILSISLWFLTSPTFGADNELTEQEKADGWKLLFNGKDHTGWICNTGKEIQTPVKDGCLLPYKSGGYIIMYEKPFTNFVLQCDVKMDKEKCNSGIFVRVGNPKIPVYTGIEVQIEENDNGGSPYHTFGAVYDLAPVSKDATKEPGEWNHVQVTCNGPKLSVEVNGELVTTMNCDEFDKKGQNPDGTKNKFFKAIKDFPRSGYLGFQDHDHPVWFKNVKLKELSS